MWLLEIINGTTVSKKRMQLMNATAHLQHDLTLPLCSRWLRIFLCLCLFCETRREVVLVGKGICVNNFCSISILEYLWEASPNNFQNW
jgi:hypothetical protein